MCQHAQSTALCLLPRSLGLLMRRVGEVRAEELVRQLCGKVQPEACRQQHGVRPSCSRQAPRAGR
jgi:hypothetical protein